MIVARPQGFSGIVLISGRLLRYSLIGMLHFRIESKP
jgi:hypothetical protein